MGHVLQMRVAFAEAGHVRHDQNVVRELAVAVTHGT